MATKITTNIDTWVNQRTGEAVNALTTISPSTDKDFDKVWLGLILSVLELFGNKKIDVVRYILENRNRSDNTVVITQRDLAKKAKTSYQTVNHTIQILKEANFLTQIVPGYYRINPAVIWRGGHWQRMAILAKFGEESAAAETEPEHPQKTPESAPKTLKETKRVAGAAAAASKSPAPQKPRFCHNMTSEGLRCGRLMQEIVEPDGTHWYWCDICRSGYMDAPGSVAEYSATSKKTA